MACVWLGLGRWMEWESLRAVLETEEREGTKMELEFATFTGFTEVWCRFVEVKVSE